MFSKCHDVKFEECHMVDAVQYKYFSPWELEDQNCLFWGPVCVDKEDDLGQFWCGNMVKLAAMILSIGYLALGMDLKLFFVIFTMYCFQKYLIELYIPSLICWKPWRRNIRLFVFE